MQTAQFRIAPQSAFLTPIKGDILFGHLCWHIREVFGQERLQSLLEGYLEQHPFLVVSDAMPTGYFPMPKVPIKLRGQNLPDDQLKKLKKRKWAHEKVIGQPLNQWLTSEKTEKTEALPVIDVQVMHNSINRLTMTTGEGFDPYTLHKTLYHQDQQLDIYLVFDETRLSLEEIELLMQRIGLIGYGRKASTGHGKFEVKMTQFVNLQEQASNDANAYLTLAPCRISGETWLKEHCYYQWHTHFGRHGAALVHQMPFKNPVVLMETGAVLTPKTYEPHYFVGQAITGLSEVMPDTVHQAYAPVVPVKLQLN